MKHLICFFLLLYQGWMLLAQTPVNAIYMEFGYVNVPKEDKLFEAMFGYSKYRYYMDEHFIHFEQSADLPPDLKYLFGPGLASSYIFDIHRNELFVCVRLDTVKIRMPSTEKDMEIFEGMLKHDISNTSYPSTETQQLEILGKNTVGYPVAGVYSDTAFLFVHKEINVASHLHKFPMYLSEGPIGPGLVMGRNDPTQTGKMLEFRVIHMELDRPRSLASELGAYTLVSEEEGAKAIQNFLNPK
ncbi:MAG TPA: hypothetical protein VK168_16130 [Saprospiraceae bacterium]|nr:hypothetical protein [Saprospiraceae bacterium]